MRKVKRASSPTRRVSPPRSDTRASLVRVLGAPAHVVILDEAAATFAHTHGEAVGGTVAAGHGDSHAGGHGDAGATYGPEIAFHHTFAAPGLYKVWGQFLDHHGQVITADFVVRVAQ